MTDEYTRNMLCADNHALFDKVRDRLNARPIEPIDIIARDIGVTVDDLCRWFIAYKAPRKPKAYQSPNFPAIGQPKVANGPSWTQDDNSRRFLAWKRAKDGAKAAREASNA